ncbi:hypothetical protein FOZ62_017671, partial [Perkinsus olseni]
MGNVLVVRVRYSGESFRTRFTAERFETVKNLKRLITEAWPHLKGMEYDVALADGRTFDQLGETCSVMELMEDAPKEPCGVVPELKLEVKLSAASSRKTTKLPAAPSLQPSRGMIPPPIDKHKVATLHLVDCDDCRMYPIVGKRYICIDCPKRVDLCFRCYADHTSSHTTVLYNHTMDGVWNNQRFDDADRPMMTIDQKDVETFDQLQARHRSVPIMVAEVYKRGEGSGPETSSCRDDTADTKYFLRCHSCGDCNTTARRFKSDVRDDIVLCEICYLVHEPKVLGVAYKCSRLISPGFWNSPVSDSFWKAEHTGATCRKCGSCPIEGRSRKRQALVVLSSGDYRGIRCELSVCGLTDFAVVLSGGGGFVISVRLLPRMLLLCLTTYTYRCVVCADFDLCAECYKKPSSRQHREDHCFTLIAKPVTLWSVKTREPRGVALGDLPCDMCHRLRQGGAKYTLRSLFATPMRDAHFCSDCYHTMLQREETGLRSSSNRNSPWAISNRVRSETLLAPHRRRRLSGRLRVSGAESELFQQVLEAIEADDRNHE